MVDDEPASPESAVLTSSPVRPFGAIALSLSGGGYRAAAFHLGALDMLHRLDLLRDVTALSTVSGGTFTGMRYALSLKFGQTIRARVSFGRCSFRSPSACRTNSRRSARNNTR